GSTFGGLLVLAMAAPISATCVTMLMAALELTGADFAYDSTHRRIITRPSYRARTSMGTPARHGTIPRLGSRPDPGKHSCGCAHGVGTSRRAWTVSVGP